MRMTPAVLRSKIVYLSMEIGLDPRVPTYSGGLGVLAGDTLRSAADLRVPIVGVTLLHRKGYFRQHLSRRGMQTESPVDWDPWRAAAKRCRSTCRSRSRAAPCTCAPGCTRCSGVTGHTIPVYLLDTDLPENAECGPPLTDHLYGGDEHYRLLPGSRAGHGRRRLSCMRSGRSSDCSTT